MFISSSDYDSLAAKNVLHMIGERSENNFFDKVTSIHPLAKYTRIIEINKSHNLHEFGFDCLPFGLKYKFLRFIYAPIYLIIAIIKARKIIKKNNISIVRASDPYFSAVVGYFSSIGTKIKFVIS